MQVTYELTLRTKCPANDALDVYEVTVEASRMVKVEDILAAVQALAQPAYQEELTERLSIALGCTVKTVGHHSGVKTTCTA